MTLFVRLGLKSFIVFFIVFYSSDGANKSMRELKNTPTICISLRKVANRRTSLTLAGWAIRNLHGEFIVHAHQPFIFQPTDIFKRKGTCIRLR